MPWWAWVIIGVFFLVIAPMAGIQFGVGRSLYYNYLVRNKIESWDRVPKTEDPESINMYKIGDEFFEESKDYMKPVSIVSEGLKLVGEFYDFGAKKCVLIVPGRSEALNYSYFFSVPYKKMGFNVLLIDNRSHGLSEGKYNYLGFREYLDLLGWIKFAHDELGQEEVIGHGICIGATTLVYANTFDQTPDYFKGIIAEGMYQNFPISFANHAHEAGYPSHFVSDFFFLLFRIHQHKNPHYGPINCIDKVNVPILFLYSKEDIYSTPDKSLELYNKCKSTKKIVWFEKGRHSFVRINNTDEYDNAIKEFIDEQKL